MLPASFGSLCLGKHVFPSAALVVGLAGFVVSHRAGGPLALHGWVCQRAWEAGQLVCFQTRFKWWFWELILGLLETCGSSTMGVSGGHSAGEGGLMLVTWGMQSAVDLVPWDVDIHTLCYKLRKIKLACRPSKAWSFGHSYALFKPPYQFPPWVQVTSAWQRLLPRSSACRRNGVCLLTLTHALARLV